MSAGTMPDHLAALQHILARDFCFGERSWRARVVRALSRTDSPPARNCNQRAARQIAEMSRMEGATGERVTSAA
jgi:hypothetical protein